MDRKKPRHDVNNPRLFPVDLDVARGALHFLPIDEGVLERSLFLDNRIDAPLDRATAVPLATIAAPATPAPAFLLHTSFCCSTLLARILHVPPHVVALKEPLVLRRLADARVAGRPIDRTITPVTRLLARPWASGARVLIKPTHAALNVARDLLTVDPGSRGIVLYGSLADFIVSNCKKAPETQQKVPQLVDRALAASSYRQRLPGEAFQPRTFYQLVAVQWCAQLAVVRELFDSLEGARLVALREAELLDDLEGASQRAARHLELPLAPELVRARVAAVGNQHAKAPGVPYGPAKRAEEAKLVRSMFGAEIDDALRFAERYLLPALGSIDGARHLPRAPG
jgi:hypothetical protein